MKPAVILFVTQWNQPEKEVRITAPTGCHVGRSDDCDILLQQDAFGTISRHHCLLDIRPPNVRVKDLGSLNGTFVNGQQIGKRMPTQEPADAADQRFRWHTLSGGDEILVGTTRIRVTILAGSELVPPELARDRPEAAASGSSPKQVRPEKAAGCPAVGNPFHLEVNGLSGSQQLGNR